MQKAEVVLAMLRKQSVQSKEFVFDRLYRNLFNPDFYMLAYSNIYAKEGNMTPGTDGKTIDGFNIEKVNGIIEKLRKETYYPNPSRRCYIPKKSGKLRPLGIPSIEDKLVQEVLRMMLDAIYEPSFTKTSHGFRTGKSCHTALMQVKKTCRGVVWAIEGDIKGFFDNIDHDILLKLLARKIADGRIIELVRRSLKAGYFEFHQVHNSLTGCPQGSGTSPVLANIYLHELDTYMEGLICKHSTEKKLKGQNPEYHSLANIRYRAKKRGSYQRADAALMAMQKMHSRDPMDSEFVKIHYVRYADDFLVMVNGNKEVANTLKTEIGDFLKTELKLELSEEKTLVTHLSSTHVRFLGYEIAKAHENTTITKNTLGHKARAINGTIQLLVPGDVIRNKLMPFMKNGEAAAYPGRIDDPVLNTLTVYNAEIQGLYNYYRLATDVSTKLNKFKRYHYLSLLRTIARKEQSSINKVLAKYGVSVPLKQGTGTRKIFGVIYETKKGLQTRTYFNKPLRKVETPCLGNIGNGIIPIVFLQRHQIVDRYNAGKCELCGFESEDRSEFEIHHIRKLKDVRQKYAKRGDTIPAWVLKMAAMNRKTLVACKPCHKQIHRGESNTSLKGNNKK